MSLAAKGARVAILAARNNSQIVDRDRGDARIFGVAVHAQKRAEMVKRMGPRERFMRAI